MGAGLPVLLGLCIALDTWTRGLGKQRLEQHQEKQVDRDSSNPEEDEVGDLVYRHERIYSKGVSVVDFKRRLDGCAKYSRDGVVSILEANLGVFLRLRVGLFSVEIEVWRTGDESGQQDEYDSTAIEKQYV
ncbi:hypothetical protein GQ53DRAFT_764187 [Thozetella sp. PMI_491]|nr:hypothetical protein GQ53DRAFT_764187 [Thozetella sp. PMI_491]